MEKSNIGAAVPVNGSGVYTTIFTITNASGPYMVTALFMPSTAAVAASSSSNILTVTRVDARVTPSSTNPQTVQERV